MGFKHAIPHIVERFYKNNENPFKIYGANQTRAFCYISDAAKGTVLAMESNQENSEIYHIGNDNEITIDFLTKKIGKMFDYKGSYLPAKTYPGSVSRRSPDIKKSIKLLNYLPEVDLDEGLTTTVDWYKNFFSLNKKIHSGGFKPPDKLSI